MRIVWLLYLGIMSMFDIRDCKVPVAGLVVGLFGAVCNVIWNCVKIPAVWQWSVLAMLLGALPGVLMVLLGFFTGKVGYGDGILLIGLGMYIGYKECIFLVCFSLLLMSGCCVLLLLGKGGNRNTRIPYLPYLTVVYAAKVLL